ncbi:MAG: hypothetical protein MI923_01135 [Phycisphaerales bacterium]|nr:hypothetical protein [Phycisphaerales bacterium]
MCSAASRQRRPSRPSDRPTNHQRASGGAMPAGALLFTSAKPHDAPISRQRAVAAGCRTAGWSSIWRQL